MMPLVGGRRRRWVLTLALVVLGCATVPRTEADPSALPGKNPKWKPLFRGVEFAEVRKKSPEPVALYAVRINLKERGIEFLATPSNGERPGETDGMKTSTFLKTYRCQLAINASAFSPVAEKEGEAKDIIGLSGSRGDMYSPPHSEFGALLISRANKAWIASPPIDTSEAYNVVGGFGILLKDGENMGDEDKRHPRTAAGVSRDGRYLYLAVIDGRQPAYSVGATTAEAAAWMKWLGAYSALNLDGGGSTALVVAGKKGAAKALNRPIHQGIPGTERVVGNHLGVFAAPLRK